MSDVYISCYSRFCLPSVLEMSSSLQCSILCTLLQGQQVSMHYTPVHMDSCILPYCDTSEHMHTHTHAHTIAVVMLGSFGKSHAFTPGAFPLLPFSSPTVLVCWSVAPPPGNLPACCTGQEHYQCDSAGRGSTSYYSTRCEGERKDTSN